MASKAGASLPAASRASCSSPSRRLGPRRVARAGPGVASLIAIDAHYPGVPAAVQMHNHLSQPYAHSINPNVRPGAMSGTASETSTIGAIVISRPAWRRVVAGTTLVASLLLAPIGPAAAAGPQLAVDGAADRHAISPDIYGLN